MDVTEYAIYINVGHENVEMCVIWDIEWYLVTTIYHHIWPIKCWWFISLCRKDIPIDMTHPTHGGGQRPRSQRVSDVLFSQYSKPSSICLPFRLENFIIFFVNHNFVQHTQQLSYEGTPNLSSTYGELYIVQCIAWSSDNSVTLPSES